MLSDTMMLGGGRKAAYSLENSLLFRGAQYLGRTPGAVGDRDKWTLSLHVRRAALGSYQYIYSAGPNPTTNEDFIGFDSGDRLNVRINGVTRLVSTQVFRDPTAWGHLVVAFDAANAVSSLKLRVYWNGAEITGWSTDSRAAILPGVAQTNTLNPHRLGNNVADNNGYFSGYLAEACLVDGAALPPTTFGAFDPATGNWRPKAPEALMGSQPVYATYTATGDTFGQTSGSGNGINDLSLVFDGNPAQTARSVPISPNSGVPMWVGKAFSSAQSLGYVTVYPTSDLGFLFDAHYASSDSTVTLNVYGKTSIPASMTDGTLLGSLTFTNSNAIGPQTVYCSGSYSHVWVTVGGGGQFAGVSEIRYGIATGTNAWGTNGFHLGTPFVKDNVGRDYSGLSGASFLVKPSGSAASLSADGLIWAYGGANSYTRGAHAFDAASATGVRFSFKFVSGTSQGAMVGICAANIVGATPSLSDEMYSYRFYNGQICGDGGYASRPGSISFSAGDVLDVVVQAGALYFYRNGTKLDGGLANGAWKTGLSGHWCPFVDRDSLVAISVQFNAGAVAWDYTIETTASGLVGGNDWMPNGFAASDVVADSPTNVYAVLNPLDQGTAYGTMVLSNGNLTAANSNDDFALAGVSVSSGKWYWEISSMNWAGVFPAIWKTGSNTATWGNALGWSIGTLKLWSCNNGSQLYGTAYGSTPVNGTDVVGVALDCGGGTLSFYKNGVSVGTAWSTGIAGHAWQPQCYTNAGTTTFNFGQRAWAYPPPSGFKALCTANLPATSGVVSGAFTGNASVDGPCVYTGAVPQSLTINGNAVIWGTHADRLATGFKIRTSAVGYNGSGSNTWVATYDRKPTVGGRGRAPANAQAN